MLSPFLKKLLFARQFTIEDGKIEIIKLRNMLISPDFILNLQEKDPDALYKLSKNIMKKDLDFFNKTISLKSQASIDRIKDIYEIFGFGKIQILDFDTKNKRGVVNILDSPIAKAHLLNNKVSSEPKCHFIAGKISGIFSFLFKKDVNAKEVKCMAKGDDFCQFVIK